MTECIRWGFVIRRSTLRLLSSLERAVVAAAAAAHGSRSTQACAWV